MNKNKRNYKLKRNHKLKNKKNTLNKRFNSNDKLNKSVNTSSINTLNNSYNNNNNTLLLNSLISCKIKITKDSILILDNHKDFFNIQTGKYKKYSANHSKLIASIIKDNKILDFIKDKNILYLGCSHGYTVSFLSNLAKIIFAVDIAYIPLINMLEISETYKNIAVILEDANHPERYINKILNIDLIFQDIAQRNQYDIFVKNMKLFKSKTKGILSLKCNAIDVNKSPKTIFKETKEKIIKDFKLLNAFSINEFEKNHYVFIVENK